MAEAVRSQSASLGFAEAVPLYVWRRRPERRSWGLLETVSIDCPRHLTRHARRARLDSHGVQAGSRGAEEVACHGEQT